MQEKNKYERDFLLLIATAKKQLEFNNYKGALKTLATAEGLLNKKISNKEICTFILSNLFGSAYLESSNDKQALIHFQKALTIANLFANMPINILKNLYGDIGIASNYAGKWEQSIHFFQKQFNITEENKDYFLTIEEDNYALYTKSLVETGRYEKAIEIGLAGLKLGKLKTNFATTMLPVQANYVCDAYNLLNQTERGLMIYIDTLSFLDKQETINKDMFKNDTLMLGKFMMNVEQEMNIKINEEHKSFLKYLMDKYVKNTLNS